MHGSDDAPSSKVRENPAYALSSNAIEQDIRFQQPPEPPGQPDITEAAEPFEVDVLELDQHRLVIIRFVVMGRVEERGLGPGPALAGESTAQLSPAAGLTASELAEVGDHAVSRTPGRPNRLNEDPLRMLLAALPSPAAFEKHDAIEPPLGLMIASKTS